MFLQLDCDEEPLPSLEYCTLCWEKYGESKKSEKKTNEVEEEVEKEVEKEEE